ncbi:MAG: flagellar biosynthetic protein FliO [Candidatus Cloacimonadales bacterium]
MTSLEGTATPSFAIMMGKMIFSLIIISLILYIALRLFKSLNRGLSLKSKNNIKVIETQPLAYKQLVQLVLISKKLYIIASNQNTIKVIDIIENQEEIEEITNQKPQQENSIFISLYAKHLKKKGKNEH